MVVLWSFQEVSRKDPSNKDWVVRTEQLEASHTMELACIFEGADLDSLPNKLVNFSNHVGMLVTGFEKEINSFLKILKLRKGRKERGAKVSSEKSNFPLASHFEREIHKLECSVNYNSSPHPIRGRERSTGDSMLVLWDYCLVLVVVESFGFGWFLWWRSSLFLDSPSNQLSWGWALFRWLVCLPFGLIVYSVFTLCAFLQVLLVYSSNLPFKK